MVWYSHLFQNFPQFIVIHTVKGFGIVNQAEIDVFLELACFFNDPADVGSLISGSSAVSKSLAHNLYEICSEEFGLQAIVCLPLPYCSEFFIGIFLESVQIIS